MSAVSAADVDDCNLTSVNDSLVLNEGEPCENSEIHSFDNLSCEINATGESGELVLGNDYSYVNGSNKGILISKSITIDGRGHTLDGKGLSRIFNVTADNVVLKNINFVNGNAFGRYFSDNVGGGAIYWSGANGVIENCNFTNNSGNSIEEDPFDTEEEIITEDGIIHIIHIRPMGAKTNEGGAIVWKGNNGTVSGCTFINNNVGYPNSGGAICWRGNNGKVIDSEFYRNSAWCGAAICWIGDNGAIYSSKIINQEYFDGGIYWFGKKGTIKYSILLGLSSRLVVRVGDVDLNADYNFWGDTVNRPNSVEKVSNVKKWFVLNCTHNGEFLTKGTHVFVEYDINSLYDRGIVKNVISPIDFSGQINYTVSKTGFLTIALKDNNVVVKMDSKDRIVSKNLKRYYSGKVTYKVKVYDVLGKVVNGKVTFKINGKVYKVKTNGNGVAFIKVKLKPGKYAIHTLYGDAKVKNKIVVKTTLITKNLSKKARKSANFKVKVLNSKGKPFKNQKVKIKFKGKFHKIKTNKKGIVIFKVPQKLKVGKYKIRTIYNGLTNLNKIIVKK